MKRTIEKLVDQVLAFEVKAEESYSHFSKKFSADDDAHEFWKSLAHDEIEHAEYANVMLTELSHEQRTIEPKYSDWYPVEQCLSYMENNPYKGLGSVQEAYEYTEKVENYEVTSIVQLIGQEHMPESYRTELLHKQLIEHYGMIERFKNRAKGSI